MPYKYIGRTHTFKGKTLWEIVGNLKNFGVGRVVVRQRFERYPEPSYLRIVKVQTDQAPEVYSVDNLRRVRVWVEKTFRGRKNPEMVSMYGSSYKTDYKLIPKDEEESYCSFNKSYEGKIMPRTMPFPPLLKELILREMKLRDEKIEGNLELPIKYREGRETYYRVAEEGETPNGEFIAGLGVPASPNLYKGVKFHEK